MCLEASPNSVHASDSQPLAKVRRVDDMARLQVIHRERKKRTGIRLN